MFEERGILQTYLIFIMCYNFLIWFPEFPWCWGKGPTFFRCFSQDQPSCLPSPCLWPLKVSPAAAAAAKSLQLCPILCDPLDGSLPGSPVPGILQARILEWVAISFSNAWKWKVKVKSLSRVWLLVTPWTAAHQAPPSMGFSRQEYWSGVPFPSPTQQLVTSYF